MDNNSNRYTFVINYKVLNKAKNWVNNEHIIKRSSLNNHWFLEADYVIDNVKNKVIKNRYNLIDDKNILLSYATPTL